MLESSTYKKLKPFVYCKGWPSRRCAQVGNKLLSSSFLLGVLSVVLFSGGGELCCSPADLVRKQPGNSGLVSAKKWRFCLVQAPASVAAPSNIEGCQAACISAASAG